MDSLEEWRLIPNYNNLYEVSNTGRIRSAKSGKDLYIGTSGRPGHEYKAVRVYRERVRCTLRIHQAVYAAFGGEVPYGSTIDHRDRNKANNHINNLIAVHYTQQYRNQCKGSCEDIYTIDPDRQWLMDNFDVVI